MTRRPVAALAALGALLAWAAPGRAQLLLESDDSLATLSGRIQAGYNYRIPRAGAKGHEDRAFILKDARVHLDVEFLDVFSAELAFDLVGNQGSPEAKDLWIGWEPTSWLRLQAGQFKAPVSRQMLTSDGKLTFPSRPALVDEFVPGRDVGAMLSLFWPGKHYRLDVGAFNGRGPNVVDDDAEGTPLVATRFVAMPFSLLDNSDGDLEHTRSPAVSVGLNGAWSDDAEPAVLDGEPAPLHSIAGTKLLYGGDATLKWRGLFVTGELLFAHYVPDAGPSYDAAGYLVEIGYFIDPLRLEPAVQFNSLNPNDRETGDREMTLVSALNFYPLREHTLKAMLSYVYHLPATESDNRGWKADDVRLLVQLAFE